MRVRNRRTGLTHDVPEGHWSIGDPRYDVVRDKPRPARADPPTDEPEKAPKPRARKSTKEE